MGGSALARGLDIAKTLSLRLSEGPVSWLPAQARSATKTGRLGPLQHGLPVEYVSCGATRALVTTSRLQSSRPRDCHLIAFPDEPPRWHSGCDGP